MYHERYINFQREGEDFDDWFPQQEYIFAGYHIMLMNTVCKLSPNEMPICILESLLK